MLPAPSLGDRFRCALFAGLPLTALTAAIPLVNRAEPRIAGLPFVFAWVIAWVLLTPACLWLASGAKGEP